MFTISDEEILDYTNQYRKEADGIIIKYGRHNLDQKNKDGLDKDEKTISRRLFYFDYYDDESD